MNDPRRPAVDVRMRGFTARTLVETAVRWIDEHVHTLDAEVVPLGELHGRVLAGEARSTMNVPPFDRSAMDGYALRGAETVGASEYNPLALPVRGEALPGRPHPGRVEAGTAVRIMTGAPMPDGADAVVPAEFATERDGTVEITAPLAPGKNVGRCAEDVSVGSVLLAAGRRLRAQDVGLLASVGIDRAEVVRRPRVRIIVTGDELASPGEPKGLHQIYDANSSMLQGLLLRDGGALESLCKIRDDRAAIREAMRAPEADVLLISG